MKTTIKWILGIVIGLVVVAVVVIVGYLVINQWGGVGWMTEARAFRQWDGGRVMPWGGMPRDGIPMHPYRGIPGLQYGGFFPLRTIAGGLICLGFLGLLVLGIVALVRGLSSKPQPAVTTVTAGSPIPSSTPAPTQATGKTCPNCGRQVQADWSHCAYCGNALTGDLKQDTPQA